MKTPQKNRRTTRQTAPRPRPEGSPRAGGPANAPAGTAGSGAACRRSSRARDWLRAAKPRSGSAPVVSPSMAKSSTLGTRARGGDQVRLDGRLVRQAPTPSLRPPSCAIARRVKTCWCAAREDSQDEAEAMAERLSRRVGRRYVAVSPMPRIDGGMELLTSDGELATRLQRAVRAPADRTSACGFAASSSPEQIEGHAGRRTRQRRAAADR